jgi:ABC-type multidrug transport system fused ATPase/permease subunit
VEYEKCLEKASNESIKFAIYSGLGIAGIFFVMLASYSLGFWYGSRCILGQTDCPRSVSRQDYTAGSVLTVFFSIIMGGFNVSQLTPAFKKVSEGRQAAARIFAVIDREPKITNPANPTPITDFKGKIRF